VGVTEKAFDFAIEEHDVISEFPEAVFGEGE
jgi:hypothetical protein